MSRQVNTVTDAAGTISATADLVGRRRIYTDVFANTTTYAYDQPGRLITTDDAGVAIGPAAASCTLAFATYVAEQGGGSPPLSPGGSIAGYAIGIVTSQIPSKGHAIALCGAALVNEGF